MGLCFVLFGLIKGMGHSDETYIDEMAAVGAMVFFISGILSHISIHRSKNAMRCERKDPIKRILSKSIHFVRYPP